MTFTTFAGPGGGAGSADGNGSAARFALAAFTIGSGTGLRGVATDSSGNVYVADTFNGTIRKITPTGLVTTLAGLAGFSDYADGVGSAARFDKPEGVAVDSAGNVYVADTYNHTIRKITPSGIVTTLAGAPGSKGSADGTGFAAQFYFPQGLATDSPGNVYVADATNHTIRKITPAGVVTTLAGTAGKISSEDGVGSAAGFSYLGGAATDNRGIVYVADSLYHTIRKITPAGVVTTLAGAARSSGSADGIGSVARFNSPTGVATDSGGNIYVSDSGNHTIRKITPAGVVTTLAGSAGSKGSADGTGIAARFDEPGGAATDSSGNVYVADSGNNTIRKITPAGVVTTLAGAALVSDSVDGTGSAARFNGPSGVATDGKGNAYAADSLNNTIRKITAVGVVTTLAGSAGVAGSADGTGIVARFNHPARVATDSDGNVYVADTINHTIRKVTPAGAVTTVAGSAFISGGADGTGNDVRFSNPHASDCPTGFPATSGLSRRSTPVGPPN